MNFDRMISNMSLWSDKQPDFKTDSKSNIQYIYE